MEAYNEALKARGSLLIWLDPKMDWHGQPSGKRGRTLTRKNAKPWKTNRRGADACDEILHTTRRLGRAIRKKWSGYHRRSHVETKMRCFKLLGEPVMARNCQVPPVHKPV